MKNLIIIAFKKLKKIIYIIKIKIIKIKIIQKIFKKKNPKTSFYRQYLTKIKIKN